MRIWKLAKIFFFSVGVLSTLVVLCLVVFAKLLPNHPERVIKIDNRGRVPVTIEMLVWDMDGNHYNRTDPTNPHKLSPGDAKKFAFRLGELDDCYRILVIPVDNASLKPKSYECQDEIEVSLE